MQLRIVPSPADEVVLMPYRAEDFPVFHNFFEAVPMNSPLRGVIRAIGSRQNALVLQNRSTRDIAALRSIWTLVDARGESRKSTSSGDSYMFADYRAVVASGGSRLITPTGSLDEGVATHILSGGGTVGSGSGKQLWADAVEAWFQIDFLMFADGEILGPDSGRYALELQCRKQAAEYVARHARSAIAEGRDPTPVMLALRDFPYFGPDPLAKQVSEFARTYLQHARMKRTGFDPAEADLRHWEKFPELPKFFRRNNAS